MAHVQKPFNPEAVPAFKKGPKNSDYSKLCAKMGTDFSDADFLKFCQEVNAKNLAKITSRDQFAALNFVRGATKSALADCLGVSRETVDNNLMYVRRCMEKFHPLSPHVQSKADLPQVDDENFNFNPWPSVFLDEDVRKLSKRTVFALHCGNIYSAEQLVSSEKELRKLNGIGNLSIEEIKVLLATRELFLSDDPKNPLNQKTKSARP